MDTNTTNESRVPESNSKREIQSWKKVYAFVIGFLVFCIVFMYLFSKFYH